VFTRLAQVFTRLAQVFARPAEFRRLSYTHASLEHRTRAAYGAIIGGVAAAFKLFAPWSEGHSLSAIAREFVGAALAFALLCGIAAALRNFIVRRVIWPKIQ